MSHDFVALFILMITFCLNVCKCVCVELQGPRKKILLALLPRSKRQPWQFQFWSKVNCSPLFVFVTGSNYQDYFTWHEWCVQLKFGLKVAHESIHFFPIWRMKQVWKFRSWKGNLRCNLTLPQTNKQKKKTQLPLTPGNKSRLLSYITQKSLSRRLVKPCIDR